MKKYPPFWLMVFNGISTTNLRVIITMVLGLGTGLRLWITGDSPDSTWLGFIIAFLTADVAQFTSKRMTDSRRFQPNLENNSVIESSTDVRELASMSGKG